MIAIMSLLVVLSVSVLMTRIATLALTYTGLSRQTARFQARSAFTGVGYTTSESEKLVNHPQRRRILFILMLLGNAGIVTVISAFILGFVRSGEESAFWLRILVLTAGIGILMTLASSRWVDKYLSRFIIKVLKRFTRLDVMDYASLLHLAGDFSIHELYVEGNDWMANQMLKDLKLKDEGVLVLGITRKDGMFVGTPSGDTQVHPSDTLILYGRGNLIARLDRRKKGVGGQLAHVEAVNEQKSVHKEEKQKDTVENETLL